LFADTVISGTGLPRLSAASALAPIYNSEIGFLKVVGVLNGFGRR
jgi:hypothetical protein